MVRWWKVPGLWALPAWPTHHHPLIDWPYYNNFKRGKEPSNNPNPHQEPQQWRSKPLKHGTNKRTLPSKNRSPMFQDPKRQAESKDRTAWMEARHRGKPKAPEEPWQHKIDARDASKQKTRELIQAVLAQKAKSEKAMEDKTEKAKKKQGEAKEEARQAAAEKDQAKSDRANRNEERGENKEKTKKVLCRVGPYAGLGLTNVSC